MKAAEARTRIELKNILYLTDFSIAARAAAPFAVELARTYGSKIHALHCRPPIVNPMTPPESWRSAEAAAAAEAEKQKQELRETLHDVSPDIMIMEGSVGENVAWAIEDENIDLLVMGTHGRSGIGKLLLGSVAEEVFRQAHCPVLTVGPNTPPGAKPGEFKKILFATELNPASTVAADFAMSLAQECQARLTLLHVIDEPRADELVAAPDVTDSDIKLLHQIVRQGSELASAPEYLVEVGPPAEKILEVARREGSDVIVLGARHPSGFPGAATHLPFTVAHQVVSHAPCPVLTIRE
jgi:nucleotide-binding universal stress UspA family protein